MNEWEPSPALTNGLSGCCPRSKSIFVKAVQLQIHPAVGIVCNHPGMLEVSLLGKPE